MGSEVFEEPIDLEMGTLEPLPISGESFPYPGLSATPRSQRRAVAAAILENDFLRATFVPALGGRLLSLLDKRSDTECLAAGPLVPVPGGRRGARLAAGLQLHLDGQERLTSIGNVQYAGEPGNNDRPAGLWLSEAVTGTGMSWHLHVSLPPDRAELQFEARIYNRSGAHLPYNPGFLLPADGGLTHESALWTPTLVMAFGEAGRAAMVDQTLLWCRFDEPRFLAPRQLDTWTGSIIPVPNLGRVDGASALGALRIEGRALQILSARYEDPAKVVVQCLSGETLEAFASLSPTRLAEFNLPEPAEAIAVIDAAGSELLRWDRAITRIPPDAISTMPAKPPRSFSADTFDVATRYLAYAGRAEEALAQGDYDKADENFERALLYNGDDHFLWWGKAVAKRLAGSLTEQSDELLNAHYLAPLEPVLRAESYLSQPVSLEREPSPLVQSIADHPENFVEVAAALLRVGLFQDAARWIDEALRHVDLAALRYLLAYSHLRRTGMEFEAATQVSKAATSEIFPLPWRAIERAAIAALHARFPSDARLSELAALLERMRP